MKINLHTIEHELGDCVTGASLHSNCNDPKLDYPILFNLGDHRYYDNVLYVAVDKHLEKSKDKIRRYLNRNPSLTFSCICIGEAPNFCTEVKNCDIIWIDPQKSRTGIFNAVQKVFQRFNAWERELDVIIDRGGELADLANASLKIFKNDICITDPFSRVLVHRIFRNERLTYEQTSLIKEGEYLPKSMVFDGVEDEQDGEDFVSFMPTFSTMHAFHCTVLRSIIPISPDYAVILSIHPDYQDVDCKDCAPTLVLAAAIKKLYTSFGTMESGSQYVNAHTTFKDFIQGKAVSDADLVQCSITLGWNRDIDEYLCFCIDFMPNMQIQDCYFMRPYVAICNRIQTSIECVAFVLDSRIAVVVDLSRVGIAENDLYERFRQFAEDYRLIIGASAPYAGLKSLPESYRQAFNTLALCHTEQCHLVCFGDHALDIGMNFIMKEMRPEHFCPRSLIELAQSDPNLYLTLETYLKENCNSNVAAKRLSLQRNSFVYRLEKAKKAVGFDLDDPDTRLLLLISIKLIDLYGLDNIEPLMPAGNSAPPPSTMKGTAAPARKQQT